MNGHVIITTTESSAQELERRLDWLLDLMDKEHRNASTHAQRNNYQAVIRHELEILRDMVRYAQRPGSIPQGSDIPF